MSLPLGYRYAATYAGIRKTPKPDLILIVSEPAAAGAAMFTTNLVQAAPVKLCRKHLAESGGVVRAVMINAGNANCATRTGDRVAAATTRALAKTLGCPMTQVLPSSTGVIGVEMDGSKIIDALPRLMGGLSADGFQAAAESIMTTDTVPKTAFAEAGGVRIAGMTKGSGMIQPNMATTLGYVVTDAAIPGAKLKKMLRAAVERSYHRVSVDGDTSTNDTVVLLANGASGMRPDRHFEEALGSVFESLAQQIARDGEGARKLIHIEVSGARTDGEAARIARAIANSPLVKTAVAGSDPNWGRILCAAGYSGAVFDPRDADIYLQGVRVCRMGLAADFDEALMTSKLNEKDCRIRLALRGGAGSARFWTCDLTEGYIEINGSYRT